MENSAHRLDRRAWIALGLLTLVAFFVRGHQFLDQVVIDDEWHALHMVMNASTREILTSFGVADYSIPLTLYYKAIAQTMGLSELGMRAPMFLSSLACVLVFGAFVWRRFGARVAVVFCVVMITSPLLFYYSRIARPYGLSLLWAPLCLWWFTRWWQSNQTRFAIAYVMSAVLLTWLHLLNAPFVFAPFLWALAYVLQDKRKRLAFFTLGAACAIGLALTILPPLLLNPSALGEKVGSASPSLSTIFGALHQWFGSAGVPFVIVGIVLAALGAPRVRKSVGIFADLYFLGLVFTIAAVFVLQPAWVTNSMTFARYLVLLIPALLLCVAVGIIEVGKKVAAPTLWCAAIVTCWVLSNWITTPLYEFFGKRMHYTGHSYFHFDVRAKENPIRPYLQGFSQTPAWESFTSSRVGRSSIGVFPWTLESFFSDHPIIQQRTRQRVVPVSMEGVCMDWTHGSPRIGRGITLRNFVLPSQLSNLTYIALRKSYTITARSQCLRITFNEEEICRDALVKRLGAPIFEDDVVVIFKSK